MKVCVCAQITYLYDVELDAPFDDSDIITIDSADPVYGNICKLMDKECLAFEGRLVSVVDDETDEILYEGE